VGIGEPPEPLRNVVTGGSGLIVLGLRVARFED